MAATPPDATSTSTCEPHVSRTTHQLSDRRHGDLWLAPILDMTWQYLDLVENADASWARAADSLPHDLLCCLRIPFPTNQCTMASDGKAEEVVAPKSQDADEEVFIMTIRFHVRCLPAWMVWRGGMLVGWLLTFEVVLQIADGYREALYVLLVCWVCAACASFAHSRWCVAVTAPTTTTSSSR